MAKNDDSKPKKGEVVLSRTALYNKLAAYTPQAIQALVSLLDSNNPSIRLGAANKIIDKVLPSLKATELTGEEGGAIKISIVDYSTRGGAIPPDA